MVWMLQSDDEADAIQELSTLSDRAAGILAATIVDDRLTEALQRRLINDEHVQREMFRSSGPLGSFSAKIKMAYLIGMCDSLLYADLENMKNIRNAFAHQSHARNFETQRVADLTRNFKIIDLVAYDSDEKPSDKTYKFAYRVEGLEEQRHDARHRYLISAQIFVLAFALTPGRGGQMGPMRAIAT